MAQDTGGAKDAGPWIDPLKYVDAKPDLPKDTIETAKKIGPLTNIFQAAAEFGLGEQLYKSGHQTEAIAHFKEAQRLNPKSWNYKRQAYALTGEKEYGTTFRDEVVKAGGSKAYYPPPELPGEKKP